MRGEQAGGWAERGADGRRLRALAGERWGHGGRRDPAARLGGLGKGWDRCPVAEGLAGYGEVGRLAGEGFEPVGSGGSRGRCPGGQTEVGEDLRDHLGLIDRGHDAHAAAAAGALQDVDGEDPPHELGP